MPVWIWTNGLSCRITVHLIILIDAGVVGAVREPPADGREKKMKPLSGLVDAFKTVSSKKINQMRCGGTPGEIVWRRNYYEHVIHGENELEGTRYYIYFNPQAWQPDPENPHGRGGSTTHGTGGSRTAPTEGQRRKR